MFRKAVYVVLIGLVVKAKGIEASREPVTTALGKMAGCLLGSGSVLCVALLLGIRPSFG